MQKFLLVVLVGAALGMGGWRGFQYYRASQAKPKAKAPAPVVAGAKAPVAPAVADTKQQAEAAALRTDIEAQLKPLKVTSIMPGEPGIVIIDKKEYAEGDPLALHGGKKLRVAKVEDDGVLLAYNGLTFRLDPPAAPDLDALRKK